MNFLSLLSGQFQASSWLVSQVVGSRDRSAASMQDLNSERFMLSPDVLAMRMATISHSCCNRFISEICSTMAVKQLRISFIHFRLERPITAEFQWNISSNVFGTSMCALDSLESLILVVCFASLASSLRATEATGSRLQQFRMLKHELQRLACQATDRF